MADDLAVLVDSFHQEVARAFHVPLHMLLPRVAEEADMERFFAHQSNLMNSVVAGMKIKVGGDTNRQRTYIKKITSASGFETVTYVRPSRGFARHNRRLKQESRK